MTNLQPEKQIYDKPFEERKKFGDIGEECFGHYLTEKYGEGKFTHRDKEKKKEKDFKLPDFALNRTPEDNVEFEVKTTTKIKIADFSYQYQDAVKRKIVLWYIYVKFMSENVCLFRPIRIEYLLDYRVMGKNGVYEDSIPKPYFIVDWGLYLKNQNEQEWIYYQTPFQLPTS